MYRRKLKYALPTMTFPYKITTRLNIMSLPKKQVVPSGKELLPPISPAGVRMSALKGRITERINECAWPYVRRLVMLKEMYKGKFSRERIAKIDRMIAAANTTMYSKLSNSVFIFRKQPKDDTDKGKKKKGWNETDWRKHMDYISQISSPKSVLQPPPVDRGPKIKLEEMMPRIEELCQVAPVKMYKRMSKEEWYRDPLKISPKALQYVTTERVKILAKPKTAPPEA